MIVTTLDGQKEMLTDYSGVSIVRKVNGEQNLNFTVYKTDKNTHSYPLIQDESILTVDGEDFIIKVLNEGPYSKNGVAINAFFDCIDDYVEELWPDGLYTIQESLQHAFSTSSWTYVISDSYPQRAKLEQFGADNVVSMLNKILNAFSSEYEIDTRNKRITVKRRLGYDTDYQIRYKHNLQTIQQSTNSNDVKTAVQVFYNLDEFGNYNNSVIYYSPNKDKYPKLKWREPIYSDIITTESQAIATARLILKDTPDITLRTEFLALQQAGYESDKVELGNGVWLIDERMDIKMSARIIEIETFPYDNRSPIATISNYQKMITDTMVQRQQEQAVIERTAVKQHSIYNGCTITKEDGFKAVALNGVEAFLNASEGIAIKRNGKYKFYASAIEDELILDGKLYITANDNVMLQAYMDENGGTLNIFDVDTNLNVEIGSNQGRIDGVGGVIRIYDDTDSGGGAQRCAIYVDRDSRSGIFTLSNSQTAAQKLFMTGKVSDDAMFYLVDNDDTICTSIGVKSGFIDGSEIVTRAILNPLLDDIWDAIHDLQP